MTLIKVNHSEHCDTTSGQGQGQRDRPVPIFSCCQGGHHTGHNTRLPLTHGSYTRLPENTLHIPDYMIHIMNLLTGTHGTFTDYPLHTVHIPDYPVYMVHIPDYPVHTGHLRDYSVHTGHVPITSYTRCMYPITRSTRCKPNVDSRCSLAHLTVVNNPQCLREA